MIFEPTGRALSQHLRVDSAKVRAVLGWQALDPGEILRRPVRWHLDNPPSEDGPDWCADEAGLSTAD
jgi:hypothetical protein